MTGTPPYDGESKRRRVGQDLRDAPTPLRALRPECPRTSRPSSSAAWRRIRRAASRTCRPSPRRCRRSRRGTRRRRRPSAVARIRGGGRADDPVGAPTRRSRSRRAGRRHPADADASAWGDTRREEKRGRRIAGWSPRWASWPAPSCSRAALARGPSASVLPVLATGRRRARRSSGDDGPGDGRWRPRAERFGGRQRGSSVVVLSSSRGRDARARARASPPDRPRGHGRAERPRRSPRVPPDCSTVASSTLCRVDRRSGGSTLGIGRVASLPAFSKPAGATSPGRKVRTQCIPMAFWHARRRASCGEGASFGSHGGGHRQGGHGRPLPRRRRRDDLGGGSFGVRRPLRFLAYKLELDEAQVTELAAILADLKTERAQARVDERRSTSASPRSSPPRRSTRRGEDGHRRPREEHGPRGGRRRHGPRPHAQAPRARAEGEARLPAADRRAQHVADDEGELPDSVTSASLDAVGVARGDRVAARAHHFECAPG